MLQLWGLCLIGNKIILELGGLDLIDENHMKYKSSCLPA